METINLHDPQQLAEQLGDRIVNILEQAIETKGFATLVVSGGSTPRPLFDYLSHKPIDWGSVMVTLADERCVAPDSDQSNARLVREYLLQNQAATANFVPLHSDGIPLQESVREANKRLSVLPKFDCVILGMGNDGHTASIFPEASGRDEALNLDTPLYAMLIDPVTVGPLRITQTAKRLLNSELLVVHITGDEKSSLLEQILSAPDPRKWPIALFLTQTRTPTTIYKNSSQEQESRP